jgi:hypothetical protein
MTAEELAARLTRARRWLQAGTDLRGEPALAPEDETEATLRLALAAEPLLRIRNGDPRCVIALRAG